MEIANGSAVMRIRIKKYKMKEKLSLTNKYFGYFFKPETNKVAFLKGLGNDLKIFFFFLTFKRWFEIKLVISLSWIRIRIDQILKIRIRSKKEPKFGINF